MTPYDGLEIVSVREFAAPRSRVFEAFSHPGSLQQWWGPKGFTNNIHEFDFQPGGRWRLTMNGPNGASYDMEKTFVEVVPPEKISFRHAQPMHTFLMTMTFAEANGRTTVTWTMNFESPGDNEQLRDVICAANEENFDRLEAFLARTA